ncbi:hypothetical protein ACFLXZ_01300 [Chloroflexota bacterium]
MVAGILYLAFGNSGVPSELNFSGPGFILGNYGFLTPILAAAAIAMSSLTVALNSLRLRRYNPKEKE